MAGRSTPLETGPARPLAGWGRYPVAQCSVASPGSRREAAEGLAPGPALIARGNGRSYGDSSLSPGVTVATGKLDRMLGFDEASGLLVCEAGVLLADIIDALLPRGWFPPVTPGTKLVTVGGLIASDVHGKNHHGEGSFCDHLGWVDLAIGDGEVLRCSAQEHPDLFAATCGGMGLTGVILAAAIHMKRVETAWIRQKTLRARSLPEAIDLFEASAGWTYSVSWIDGLATGADLGRCAIFLGEHAALEELAPEARRDPFARRPRKPKSVPVNFPGFALSRPNVRLFNMVYYRAQRPGEALVDFDPYFYPLDAIGEWNRIYGKRGFVQYQCVLPLESSLPGMTRLLTEISRHGSASFLSVLKRMGPQSFGHLSFPMPGYTLALDFPATPATFELFARLDAIVADHGGRLYLAKDSRASPQLVERGYPRLPEFRAVRERYGLADRFRSLQSQRLGL